MSEKLTYINTVKTSAFREQEMLCKVCALLDLLSERDSLDHHASFQDVVAAAGKGCEMCEAIRQQGLVTPGLFGDTRIRVQLYYGQAKIDREALKPLSLIGFAEWDEEHTLVENRDALNAMFEIVHQHLQRLLIDNWVNECFDNHVTSCPQRRNNPLPTRVLDVGLPSTTSSNWSIRVAEPRKAGSWLSLSHCWGPHCKFTTTSENLHARKESIDFQDLPRTFQDAVKVTRILGFQYLWIDSLCILQDDRQDWAEEAARMHLYYKNASLTIAVDSAASDDEGFLHIERSNEQPLAVFPITSFDGQHSSDFVFVRKARRRVKEPLDTRGWTLQENILSPRTLHYTSRELKWECQTQIAFESDLDPGGDGYGYNKQDFLTPPRAWFKMSPDAISADPGLEWLHWTLLPRWYDILDEYNRRVLTYQSDKLPAISGVAREVQSRTGYTYRAGIWLEDIHRGLLWSYRGCGQKLNTYRAPSWSWAATDAQIPRLSRDIYHHVSRADFKFEQYSSPKATILDCQATPKDNDPYGAIVGGHLTLRAFCVSWRYVLQHGQSHIWSLPPILNRYDRAFASGESLLDSESEAQVICSFDELDKEDDTGLFSEVSLLRIGRCSRWLKGHFALLLKPTGKEGHFRRVGIAELPYDYDEFVDDGWEMRDVTII